MEHYSDLYSSENNVSPSAIDAVECQATMEELDTEPTFEELSKVIDSLARSLVTLLAAVGSLQT